MKLSNLLRALSLAIIIAAPALVCIGCGNSGTEKGADIPVDPNPAAPSKDAGATVPVTK